MGTVLVGDGLSVLFETCGQGVRIEVLSSQGLVAWRLDAHETQALRAFFELL